MKITTLIPISLLLVVTSSVNGATIVGTVTANVITIDAYGSGAVPAGVSIGSTLTLSFSYNSLALPDGVKHNYSADPNRSEYGTGLNLSIVANCEGNSWSGFASDGSAVMAKGANGGLDNRFELEVRRSYGGTFASFPGDTGGASYLAFVLSNTTAPWDLTNSLDLPTSLSDLNLAAALRTCLVKIQASQRTSDGGDVYHGFRTAGGFLEVFAQPALAVEPCEGSLRHPTHRFHFESLSLAAADMNLFAPFPAHVCNEGATITLVGAYRRDGRQVAENQVGQHTAFDRIGFVGRMAMNRPHVALGVGRHLAAAAFDLLASVEAAFLPLVIGFHRLRVEEQVARCLVAPFFWRESSLSVQQISCQTPRSFMRRKWL